MEEKRIYSLNLCVWVWMRSNIEPEIHRDEVNDKFYFTFEQEDSVIESVEEYKCNETICDIKVFCHYYKRLRYRINTLRQEIGLINSI